MSGIKLNKQDVDRFVRMLKGIATEVHASNTELVRHLAKEVKLESQMRAPIKTGALENSHFITVSGLGGKIRAEIGFGPVYNEAGEDYSVRMHEGLDGKGEPYNLGEWSEDKNGAQTPHRGKGVGMKFLKRGFEHVMRNIKVFAAMHIDKAIKKAARRHGGRTL